ncbi:hypothetical protein [Novosphingopyxis sp. YJ-S2-01]|uniref:hypothetical protein n=1 Tax=Novosphingopyxis sp. YJ-S2-01 TaxID=2794021 RepID=UPI0018DCA2E4|nr:hypothetical protein [Novosphingopyxis sp. YJ-S2-01]MBH9537499.1 hypothetical protein [Novosphingopyxis sp. YJ-S2-01]
MLTPAQIWVLGVIIAVIAFLLYAIVERFDKLLQEIKGLRWQLEQMENRQERHTEYLHGIRHFASGENDADYD